MSNKATTGSDNAGMRSITEPGVIELKKLKAQTQAKIFQWNQLKKKGRKKRK